MPFQSDPIELSRQQQADLEEMARSQSLPAGFVLRAKIVLLLADGWSYQAVARKLDNADGWEMEETLPRTRTRRLGNPPPRAAALETHRPLARQDPQCHPPQAP